MGNVLGFGYAVPRRRMSADVLKDAWHAPPNAEPKRGANAAAEPSQDGKPKQEKAVAGYDEDAITLAVQAAHDTLDWLVPRGFDPATIGSVVFASTTAPFLERSPAAFLAEALGLASDVRALNIGGSISSGVDALLLANDLSGSRPSLVVATEVRTAAPGDPLEAVLGDAACAFVVSGDGAPVAPVAALGPVATLGPVARVTASCPDVWRLDGDRVVRSDDVRLARLMYQRLTARVLDELAAAAGGLAEVAGVIPYAPDPRSGMRVLKKLGLDVRKHYRDFVSIRTGLTGSAHVLLMLAAALERATAGERYLVVGYGDGATAFFVDAGDGGSDDRPRFERALGWRLPVRSYARYLESRGLVEVGRPAGDVFTSEALLERDKGRLLRLEASACDSCGSVYYIDVKRCPSCGAEGQFSRRRLSRCGKVFTYTREHYYPTPEPPLTMAVVDLDGGGRMTLQVADDDGSVGIGTPVELVLRKIHDALGQPNYFWKCRKSG